MTSQAMSAPVGGHSPHTGAGAAAVGLRGVGRTLQQNRGIGHGHSQAPRGGGGMESKMAAATPPIPTAGASRASRRSVAGPLPALRHGHGAAALPGLARENSSRGACTDTAAILNAYQSDAVRVDLT